MLLKKYLDLKNIDQSLLLKDADEEGLLTTPEVHDVNLIKDTRKNKRSKE